MARFIRRVAFNIAARALTIIPQKVPTLFAGPGSVKLVPSELAQLGAKKPLLVTDASLVKLGVAAALVEVLDSAGIPHVVFDAILPDPTYAMCAEGLAALKSGGCDSVVALGGGSVIDTAKIVRMAATHKKPVEKFAGLLPCRNSGLPFICIPTTAGTGSEATAAAVITDVARHKKSTVLDPRLPPDSAILDPALTTGLPPAMTAATGMDALTHAVEAYTNTLHYSDVDAQALEATRLIFANLERACRNGADLEAREALLRASHLAGRAFTRGFVGYVHAIAHRFGERYHVPHGLANAIVLPAVLERYIDAVPERLESLASAAGLRSDSSGARAFVDAVKSLNAKTGIPDHADFLVAADIPGIAADALKEAHGTPYPVPVVLDESEIGEMLGSLISR